jgi:putative nucleotidyltransferase with HDIG domain
MIPAILHFFKPPTHASFEMTQKAKFLHYALLISAVASFFLGIQNAAGETNLDVFLYILGGICLLCIPLNKLGYYLYTAVFISLLILVMITFSLVDGVGLMDAGLIAYPCFIILTSFLFSKRGSLIMTMFTIGSVVFVYFLVKSSSRETPEFSNETQLVVIITLLVVTGALLWIIMENWERILMNLRNTYDLTLIGWAKALEYRHQETEGHSRRVTELSVILAKELGVSGRELLHIRRGALLHDIGKMAIPDSILLKEDTLTEDEWEITKKHPYFARDLLQKISFLEPAIDIPYSHHERWDGTGYPDGLSGEAIPFGARIFSVVDVWDAMNSDRPYRPSWSDAETRAYLLEQSGKMFDPQVVRVFLALIDEGKVVHH